MERALLRPHDHMQCWRKSEIPARFHYGKNPRAGAILCLGQTGWEVVQGHPSWRDNRGDHGFDTQSPEMAALFIGTGPAFPKGRTLPAFDNVDIYPLIARLAGVTPLAERDGRIETFDPVLATSGN